jgi:hypothetical protein
MSTQGAYDTQNDTIRWAAVVMNGRGRLATVPGSIATQAFSLLRSTSHHHGGSLLYFGLPTAYSINSTKLVTFSIQFLVCNDNDGVYWYRNLHERSPSFC